MYKPSKKTIYITSAFAAVAGIVGVSSYWNDIAYAVCDKIYPEANDGEVRLKDNQGNRYSDVYKRQNMNNVKVCFHS